MSREEIASNIRYYLILELRCQNNSTQLRDLLGHPVEAFFDRDRYMNENRARSIGRRLVENEAAIARAIDEGVTA